MNLLESKLFYMFLLLLLSAELLIVSTHAVIISKNTIGDDTSKGQHEMMAAGMTGYAVFGLFVLFILFALYKKKRVFMWKILIGMAAMALVPIAIIVVGWKELNKSDDLQHNTKYKKTYLWMLILGISIPVVTVVLSLILSREVKKLLPENDKPTPKPTLAVTPTPVQTPAPAPVQTPAPAPIQTPEKVTLNHGPASVSLDLKSVDLRNPRKSLKGVSISI